MAASLQLDDLCTAFPVRVSAPAGLDQFEQSIRADRENRQSLRLWIDVENPVPDCDDGREIKQINGSFSHFFNPPEGESISSKSDKLVNWIKKLFVPRRAA